MFTFALCNPLVQQTNRYKVEDKKPIKGAANIQALCVYVFLFFFLFVVFFLYTYSIIIPVQKPFVFHWFHIGDS